MNQFLPAIRSLLAASILVVLTACATTRMQPPSAEASKEEHKAHHPDMPSAQTPGSQTPKGAMGARPGGQAGMTGSQSGGQMGMMGNQGNSQMPAMSMKEMCEMHRKMMNASPGERQAMTGGQMTPEMMEKHMQMMREQCK